MSDFDLTREIALEQEVKRLEKLIAAKDSQLKELREELARAEDYKAGQVELNDPLIKIADEICSYLVNGISEDHASKLGKEWFKIRKIELSGNSGELSTSEISND